MKDNVSPKDHVRMDKNGNKISYSVFVLMELDGMENNVLNVKEIKFGIYIRDAYADKVNFS